MDTSVARAFVGCPGMAANPSGSASRALAWRLRRFLEWATDAGLLRRVGIAYQFRHLELQDWLADASHQP